MLEVVAYQNILNKMIDSKHETKTKKTYDYVHAQVTTPQKLLISHDHLVF